MGSMCYNTGYCHCYCCVSKERIALKRLLSKKRPKKCLQFYALDATLIAHIKSCYMYLLQTLFLNK